MWTVIHIAANRAQADMLLAAARGFGIIAF